MVVGGKPLKSWEDSSYRKRAGLFMANVEGAEGGESIFLRAAQANREGANPEYRVGFESIVRDGLTIRTKFDLGHVLLRHSFQWWGGDSTNLNVFFPPSMNDSAIYRWCLAQAQTFRETQVERAFRQRKREIESEIEEEGYAADPTFSFSFKGNVNNIYIDGAASGEQDDKEPPNWSVKVNIKTMAPSEAFGVQVTKLSLDNFKAENPDLPLELG